MDNTLKNHYVTLLQRLHSSLTFWKFIDAARETLPYDRAIAKKHLISIEKEIQTANSLFAAAVSH